MGVLGLDIVLKSCVGENKADNLRFLPYSLEIKE
jgi:hypothetical protein